MLTTPNRSRRRWRVDRFCGGCLDISRKSVFQSRVILILESSQSDIDVATIVVVLKGRRGFAGLCTKQQRNGIDVKQRRRNDGYNPSIN
mmetsp:Transcript_2653/g.7343  ORF Transcript_2653/g.7343 Transcript_2653/m.7343 type:complete len:89 (-) Transcript_2653:33-299(-)